MSSSSSTRFLYRYRKASDRTFDALRQDRLYFSTPAYFNDPFDSILYFDKEKIIRSINRELETGLQNGFFTADNLKQRIKERFDIEKPNNYDIMIPGILAYDETKREEFYCSVVNQIIETRKNIINNSRVICLSELATSILMWSHYTDEHQGFAIEYCVDDLKNADVFNSVDQRLKRQKVLDKIQYSSQTPDSGQLFFDEVPNYDQEKWSRSFGKSHLYHKIEEWSYEKEWRLWISQDDFSIKDESAYLSIVPSSVILGARMSVKNKKRIFECVKERNIPIKEIQPSFNGSRFEFVIKDANTKEIRKAKINQDEPEFSQIILSM